MIEKGYTRPEIDDIFRALDWLLALSPDREIEFRADLRRLEEDSGMPYVTSIERMAKEEGRQEGRQTAQRKDVLAVLQVRFGGVPDDIVQAVNAEADESRLDELHRAAVVVSDPGEFRRRLLG